MTSARPRQRFPSLMLLLAGLGLVAYYVTAQQPVSDPPSSAAPGAGIEATASVATASRAVAPAAKTERRLSIAGTPMPEQPLPVAKPIPVRANPGETIGYTQDAAGVVRPMRAGQLPVVPNTPGSFAAVDMWADGGPVVVAVQRSQPLTAEQLAAFDAPRRGGQDGQ